MKTFLVPVAKSRHAIPTLLALNMHSKSKACGITDAK
jgi:hypothetical protein